MKAFWLAGLLLLTAPAAYAAIDGWVLALTWYPGYCEKNPAVAECQTGRPAALVLHGLWPESDEGSAEFCAGTPSLRRIDASKEWCRLPALNLTTSVSTALDATMPGRADCLDRHEWFRHGTCSAMNADRYFLAAATLVERTNGTQLGKFLQANAGKKVSAIELGRAAANDAGLQGRKAYSFICRRGRGGPRLMEVWISMTQSGPWQFPKPVALRIQKSAAGNRCPDDGMIMIEANP